MPFLNKNYQWNTVDVLQDDGLLHYGRIIDCAEEGLTIDFGCSDGIDPQFVPYGRMYHIIRYVTDFKVLERELQVPVEGLIRLSPEEPAKWYPATLLEFTSSNNVLVKAVTHRGTVLEILEHDRFRDPRNNTGYMAEMQRNGSLLENGYFVKETVELPSGLSTGSPAPGPYKSDKVGQLLVDNFNQNCNGNWMLATHIDGNVLLVVRMTARFRRKFDRAYRGTCPRLEGDTLRRLLEVPSHMRMSVPVHEVPSDSQAKLPSDCEAQEFLPSIIPPSPNGFYLEVAQVPAELNSGTLAHQLFNDSFAVSKARILPRFPAHLLKEVYQCLDGVEQAKCRRVCANWNRLLTFARIVYLPKTSSLIVPAVCLLKSWNRNTKIIINTSWENLRNRLNDRYEDDNVCFSGLTCRGGLFRCIMEETPLPVLEVMCLANITWKRRWSFYEGTGYFANVIQEVCDELNAWAGVCRTLVLKDVTVALMGWEQAEMIIHISEGRIFGNLRVEDLWTKMDESLPAVTDGDRVRLMECIAEGLGADLERELVEILNERQSDDPRENNPCRGIVWTAGDLASLDWGKLSKFTVHSMFKAASFERVVVVLTW